MGQCLTKTESVFDTLRTIKNDDIPLVSLNGLITFGKVVEVYDGDTCKIVLVINEKLEKYNCRLKGLDTPEMKPPISKENRNVEIANAHKCRNRLLQLVTDCSCSIETVIPKKECVKLLDGNTKIIKVECFEFDKYGRLLVALFPENNSTETANQILVTEKYAKLYDGGTKSEFTYSDKI